MLTTAPHLKTRQPSPTTIEYKVTTEPPLTLQLRVVLLLFTVVRLILGLSTILLLYSKWQLSPYSTALPTPQPDLKPDFFTIDMIWHNIATIHHSAIGRYSTRCAESFPIPLLLPVAFSILYSITVRLYTCESLLVLRGLGIQTSTSGGTYLSGATTRFIPTEKIQDIFINEAFRGHEVRYYLVVVVKGETEVVVVFPKILPRRAIVEKVWRGAKGCLFEGEKDRGRGKEDVGGKNAS